LTRYLGSGDYDKAKKRALKNFGKLFKSETEFNAVMQSIDPIPDPGNFSAACHGAGLNSKETKWLWGYLQHCDEALYGDDDVTDDDVTAQCGW
jgi:hypothetical protein